MRRILQFVILSGIFAALACAGVSCSDYLGRVDDEEQTDQGDGSGEDNTPGEGDGSGEGNTPGEGDGSGEGNTPGEGDGSGEGNTPSEGTASGVKGWYELPYINDADGNGIDDDNPNLVYASHSFQMGGRKYRNYTVCFSTEHHCPVWVAAPRHACYSVKNVKRKDAYKADPVIEKLAPGMQYLSEEIGSECNKGHMLGSAERLCSSEANRQVFHYSNIAPQLSSGFNTGGGGWNLLEDYIDKQVPADTLYEVIGCYFDTYVDGYGKKAEKKKLSKYCGRSDVSFPTMFYYAVLRTKNGNTHKALKDCTSDELRCVAFVRAHSNSLKGQDPSSRELMSISDLERLTGITYFPNVPQAPKDSFTPSDWGL